MRLKHLCSWTFAHLAKSVRRRLIWVPFCALALVLILLRWKYICRDIEPRLHLQDLCNRYYDSEEVVGNLCADLCHSDGVSSLSCHNHYQDKEAVFSGTWRNYSVVFKIVKKYSSESVHWVDSNRKFHFEDSFCKMIKSTIKSKFNISINDIDAKRMSYIHHSTRYNRLIEMQNVWSLLHDNEYLALLLYEKFDIFPKLLGTCGPLYAVQELYTVSGYWHLLTLYDSQAEWDKRIKISIMILDFLLHLENGLPEPLHICNVKMSHFGITDDFKKVTYINLDSVHPFSIASKITGNGSKCQRHSDCDFLNCRSFCNLITFKCQHGVVNNNLQIVCERIFLGWVLSGRLMVPGLLLGPRTPRVLIELLESCANPDRETGTPRAPATKEIRKRLYNLLVHLKSS